VPLLYDNKTADLHRGETAKVSIDYDQDSVYLLLTVSGAYPTEKAGSRETE